MFVLANFITALTQILSGLLTIYMWIIIIRALLSWVNPDPYNPIVQFLQQLTDPVLNRIRRWMPYTGGIDISPIVVILAIMFLQIFLVQTLYEIARRLGATGGGLF